MARWIIGVFLAGILFTDFAIANDKMIQDEVNAKVTQVAALLKDSYAKEYPDYRGIQILRDDKEDWIFAVAVFTIEGFSGGNNYTQFMAVFTSLSEASEGHPGQLSLLDVMAVGRKGFRSLQFKNMKIKKLKKGVVITVPTLGLGPNDPLCCPSVKSTTWFVIDPYVGERLKELKKKNKS